MSWNPLCPLRSSPPYSPNRQPHANFSSRFRMERWGRRQMKDGSCAKTHSTGLYILGRVVIWIGLYIHWIVTSLQYLVND